VAYLNKLNHAAKTVNRERGNESVIGVGSGDWLGNKSLHDMNIIESKDNAVV